MALEPPEPDSLSLGLSLAPALLAAAYAVGTAALGCLSAARRQALRDSLNGASRRAMDRYVAAPSLIEARWLLLRVAGIAATAALVAAQLRGDLAWLLALATAVVLYAVPSELGRHLVYRRAETLAPILLQLLRPAELLVVLLADPLHWVASRLAKDVRSRPPSASLTETEVEMIVSEGELNGSLDHEQSEMIRNVLDFGEVTAEEVMVPRIHVDALEASMTFPHVLEEVKRTRHSRYPVYSESVDNILGVLHVKDLFTGLSSSAQETTQLRDLVRKPVAFVAEGQLASTVLKDMRAGRHHMAVVIDEFGGFSGVVTLEDLLEEIVGDIQDEHDGDDQARIKLLGDGGALIDASLPVTDVNRQLGTDFPEGDYVSLGGLILDHLGGVPATGTRHEFLGCSLIIREADERHVALIELTGLPLTDGDGDGAGLDVDEPASTAYTA